MYRHVFTALFLSLVAACATEPVATSSQALQQEPVQAATESEEDTTPAIERQIPKDSLYPLLVAEFALRRKDYDTALQTYLEQSASLRDAGVSAYTTRLAQFMQREQATWEAARLWVELEPEDTQANATVANALVRQGRTAEALPHLEKVLAAGGSPRFPALLIGFDQLTVQQQLNMQRSIDDMAARFPQNRELVLTQALIRDQLEQYEQALALVETIARSQPRMNPALTLEADLKLKLDRDDALDYIARTVAENPGDDALRLQYARLLTRVDVERAREEFETLANASPRNGGLLFSLAIINRELGDTAAAKDYLKQIIALGQRIDEANHYLGRIAEDEGDTEQAIAAYQQVTQGRELVSSVSRGSKLLLDAGDTDAVTQWFQRLRALNPDTKEQLYGLEADILQRADRPEAAMDILNLALASYPESSSLLYSRSMVAEQLDDLTGMESDLRQIIAREPDNATALNALGYTLANRTDRLQEAQRLIEKALALQPDEPAILDSMGWVLFRQGNYQQAISFLNDAYALFPDPEVAAHLGEALWVAGSQETALKVWREALSKAPQHRVLTETLERLQVIDLVAAQ